MKFKKQISQFKNIFLKVLKENKAQVIVEYILLIVVSTTVALVLIQLVSVDPTKASSFFKYWHNLLDVIAKDIST